MQPSFENLEGRDLTTVIAVIGSGVNPVPRINMVQGWNVASNSPDTTDVSWNGHDTVVAGCIMTYAKFDPNIQVMPVRITNEPNARYVSSMFNAGVRWAVDHGAQVINFSSASHNLSLTDKILYGSAFIYAMNHNVPVVISAGNEHVNLASRPSYLANFSSPALFVSAATNPDGTLASFSNWGLRYNVFASTGVNLPSYDKYGNVTTVSGTSFSTTALDVMLARIIQKYPRVSIFSMNMLLRSQTVHETALDGLVPEGRQIYDPLASLKPPIGYIINRFKVPAYRRR